jgi:hypothetical protein
MVRLVQPFRGDEVTRLRHERARLLEECRKKQFRLHRLPELVEALKRVTTALLEQELNEQEPKLPLAQAQPDARRSNLRLPYKD